MHSLPLFVRLAGQPVLLLGEGEAAEAKRRLIERAEGVPVGADDARAGQARIAFVAVDEPEDIAAELKARGLIVNVVDRPDLCDFTTPAIVDRDPVLIAVSTGGASSGLAAALRQRLEVVLPSTLGSLARALHAARAAMRLRWPDAGDRRRTLGRALLPGGPLDPLDGDGDVEAWLAGAGESIASETLVLRPSSADPDDLTVAEVRALGLADRVVHPPETPAAILSRARADAVRIVQHAPDHVPDAPGLTVRIEMIPM